MAKAKTGATEVVAVQNSLVALAVEAAEIGRLLMEAGGELTPELETRLDVNTQLLPAKVDAYNYIIDELESQAELWKRRKDASAAIQKRFDSQAERLRNRIKFAMKEMGTTEIAGRQYKFQLRKSAPKLVIDNEAAIPAEFKMIVQTTITDTDRIKSALVDGFEVPGAKLEENGSLYPMQNTVKE
jgi:hypothetical protein